MVLVCTYPQRIYYEELVCLPSCLFIFIANCHIHFFISKEATVREITGNIETTWDSNNFKIWLNIFSKHLWIFTFQLPILVCFQNWLYIKYLILWDVNLKYFEVKVLFKVLKDKHVDKGGEGGHCPSTVKNLPQNTPPDFSNLNKKTSRGLWPSHYLSF